MNKVNFAGETWNVLKREEGKLLLALYSVRHFGDCSIDRAASRMFFAQSVSYEYMFADGFFRYLRDKYLNTVVSDSLFTESQKSSIQIIENNYPCRCCSRDELGIERWGYKMEKKKDRVFLLRESDIRGLPSSELCEIRRLRKREKIILLPSSMDDNEYIPTISFYEPWKRGVSEEDCYEVDRDKYDTLKSDAYGNGDYQDYKFGIVPCIWVDSKVIS